MKNLTRYLALAALTAIAVLVLAACGGDDGGCEEQCDDDLFADATRQCQHVNSSCPGRHPTSLWEKCGYAKGLLADRLGPIFKRCHGALRLLDLFNSRYFGHLFSHIAFDTHVQGH